MRRPVRGPLGSVCWMVNWSKDTIVVGAEYSQVDARLSREAEDRGRRVGVQGGNQQGLGLGLEEEEDFTRDGPA